MPQRGLVPAGSYSISDLETINVVNGNVFWQIPLATLPPGRAGFTAGLKLTYNSQVWDVGLSFGYSQVNLGVWTLYRNLQTSEWGGWQYGYMCSLDLEMRPNPSSTWNCNGTEDNWKIYKLSVISPDGSHHTLHPYSYWDVNGDGYYEVDPGGNPSACPQSRGTTGDMTYYTTDGSYLKVVVTQNSDPFWTNHPWTIYFPDGRTATGLGPQMTALRDPNGNTITVQNIDPGVVGQNPTNVLSDDLGRAITIQHQLSGGIVQQDTITQAAYPQGGGQTLAWTVDWSAVNLYGSTLNYVCTPENDQCPANMGQLVVSAITLPTPQDTSLQKYIFGYSDNSVPGWGELNNVTLPSGAVVHYNYAGDGANKTILDWITENPVSQKTLTWTDEADGAQRVETWQYAFNNTSSQITNPDGGVVQNFFYDPHVPSNPKRGLVFKVSQPDGSTVERTWYHNRPSERRASIRQILM